MTEIKLRKAYADCSAGQIHYRYRDGDDTPVVWLHQTASSSAMYEKVIARIDSPQRMLALDTPGFGGSFDPIDLPTMSQYAAWLLEALDDIGVEQFHVFGHHTGACLVAEMATLRPEQVLSGMMIGPVPLTAAEREEFRQHFSSPISPVADGAYLKQTWDYLADLGAHHSLDLHHRELVDTTRAYQGRFQAYSAVWDQEFTKLFAEIRCPMLLMCAEDDVLYPFFERAQEQRPDAVAATIKGSNFEPDLDPDGVAQNVSQFLASFDS